MVLMYISSHLERLPGVTRAVALMGTNANKALLGEFDLLPPGDLDAGPHDLVVAVRAADEPTAASAIEQAHVILGQRERQNPTGAPHAASLDCAIDNLHGANLAVISVPGEYAAREARLALERGLHVLVFSDHVPVEDEVRLKRLGRQRGLLVMGPDCGTALIHGAALGFANLVRRGSVGLVGASGTGMQEVSVLLDRAGVGVSHAIGTGSRDLTAEVEGLATLQAIETLEQDPSTTIIVLVSKPAAPAVLGSVLGRLERCTKPVVACVLGSGGPHAHGRVQRVATLADAVDAAVVCAGGTPPRFGQPDDAAFAQADAAHARLAPGQRYLRGLFSGGSLGYESMVIWRETLGAIWSNAPLSPADALSDYRRSLAHTAIDLGDDRFTAGRPHPMIDPSTRQLRLLQEATDPEVAVIVLDVVLGYGTHPDMAGALGPTVREARRVAQAEGRPLAVVAHVCGTDRDPQSRQAQEQALAAAGVLLAPSNAAAARLAARIVIGRTGEPS
jgi:FdrA protein